MNKYFLTGTLLVVFIAANAQGKFFGGNDDGYASATLPFVVLPVTEIELSGVQCNKNICLQWTTLQERNTNRFEIEKSTDARQFVFAGQMRSIGSSSSLRHYSFTELNPFSGNNYFRLKQVDADGRSIYSGTVLIKYNFDRLIRRIANPARYGLVIQLNNSQAATLKIFDLNGKMMFYNKYNTDNIKADISSFASGLYVLVIEAKGQIDREKLIITE